MHCQNLRDKIIEHLSWVKIIHQVSVLDKALHSGNYLINPVLHY